MTRHMHPPILGSYSHYPGLEQLICLALASESFAHQLITDPETTLDSVGCVITLTPTEYTLAKLVVGAADIYDYATQLYVSMQRHGSVVDAQAYDDECF